MNIVAIAALEAADHHAPHRRKYSGGPYIYHPMRVAGRGQILGMSDDAVAAYWLHDVPEDVAKTANERDFLIQRIHELVSPRAAMIVFGLTDPTKFDPVLKTLKRDERKKHSRDFLSTQSVEVKVGKLLDRIDNLSEMHTDMQTGVMREFGFALRYADESEALAAVLRSAQSSLHEELMDTIRRIRATANLLQNAAKTVVTP